MCCDGRLYKRVVPLVTCAGRRVWLALGSGEEFTLGLEGGCAVVADVGEHVVLVGGAYEHEHALRGSFAGLVGARGVHDVG